MIRSLAALALLATPLYAQTLAPDDLAAIAAIEERNRAALLGEDAALLVGGIAPALLVATGTVVGLERSEEEAVAATVALFEQSFALNDTLEYDIDLDLLTPERSATGRAMALAPMSSLVRLQDGRSFRARTVVLFFEDGDRWYWSRIDNANAIAALRTAYPDIDDVTPAEIELEEIAR